MLCITIALSIATIAKIGSRLDKGNVKIATELYTI